MVEVKHVGGTGYAAAVAFRDFCVLPSSEDLRNLRTSMAKLEKPLIFKRSHFTTRLPADCVYSPSHFWARQSEDKVWRVGFTKFATRMLGDMVDHDFEAQPGMAIKPGQILGWVEGFKAISDVYGFCDGEFVETNPALATNIALINKKPYDQGWLYEVCGKLDNNCVDVHGYSAILNQTIDKMLEQQQAEKGKDIE